MNIDTIQIEKGAVLAPMAGITNLPHRLLAKAAGASLVYSEMVSANGLIRKGQKTVRMLETHADEKPLSAQVFGADPLVMAEAAAIMAHLGADVVDINFGCAVRKVVKTGAGVALMKQAGRAEAILKMVRKAIDIPLTIKIRSGWDVSGKQALEIAKIAEDCGVNAIAVHPRTASQAFRGKADWSLIGKVKKHVSIPVIGNGDIHSWMDAVKMIKETGCDGVMIGRAAIGNPFLFTQIAAALKGEKPPTNSLDNRMEQIKKYLTHSVEYLGEKTAMYMMRSRLGWFVKGLPFNSRFRESIKQFNSQKEALALVESYQQDLEAYFLEKGDCELF